MNEYAEVLHRDKFHFSKDTVSTLLGVIEKYGECIIPSPTSETLPDMKDLSFYEILMERRDDNAYLVTENMKHFPNKQFVVTIREFLDVLMKIAHK